MQITQPANRTQLHQFLTLLAAGCLTTMTGGVVSPVLPEMVQHLQLDPKWAGMLVSTHALTSALATPLMGIVADRIGKLKVMLPCLVLYAIFGTSTAFLTDFSALLLSRGLLGIASGGVAAATIGLLASLYEGETRARILGYATSAMSMAAIAFPLLGGWVGSSNWQYAFYLYGLGFPLALIMATQFKDKSSASSSESVIGGDTRMLFQVIRKPSILRLYLFIAIAATIVYSVVIYTPLYLKDAIGAGPELNGFVLAIRLVGASIVSAFGASRIGKWLGVRRAIALGFALMAISLVTIPFLSQLPLIVAAAVLFGIGFGIMTPNLYDTLASYSPPELRASVLAIGTGFNSLGQFSSPIFLGPIWNYAGLPMVFYTTAGIAIAAGALSLVSKKPKA
ncbi:MAG: MFS transporter [Oculatellaceae cyanobacterium Prado106]|nr:MFS transporter [Oculatellaceae cyanobacterium Prado106]